MAVSRKSWWNIILLFAGKLSVSGVVFLGGILIARFGGPAQYALFTVGISVVLLFDGLIGSPLDTAAVRFSALHPNELTRTIRFEAMAMHLKIILAAILFLAGACFLAASRQLNFSLTNGSFPAFECAFATLALLLARSVGTGLQIRQRFRLYSFVDLSQGTVRLLGFVGLALMHRAQAVLYILTFGLAALGTACTGVFFLGQKYLLGSWPAGADAKRMLRYCGYSAGIVALGTITGRGDLLLLAWTQGGSKVSAYSAATMIAMLVAQWALFSTVLTQPKVLRLAQSGELRRLFRTNLVLVLVAAVFAAAIFNRAVLGWGVSIIFGRAFDAAIPLLQILLAGALVDLLIVPILMVFCIQACPAQVFRGEAIICAAFVGSATAAANGAFSASPEYAMAFVATGARFLKLVLYSGLFFVHTSTPAVAALSDLCIAGHGLKGKESASAAHS